jgi:hypothetical protein
MGRGRVESYLSTIRFIGHVQEVIMRFGFALSQVAEKN